MTCFADSRWWVSQGAGEIEEGERGKEEKGREEWGTCDCKHCLPAAAVQLQSYPQTQLSHFQNFHQSRKSIVWKINNINLHRNCVMNSNFVGKRKLNKYYYFM